MPEEVIDSEYELLGWGHFDIERVRVGDFDAVHVFRQKHCADCRPVYFKVTLEDLFKQPSVPDISGRDL